MPQSIKSAAGRDEHVRFIAHQLARLSQSGRIVITRESMARNDPGKSSAFTFGRNGQNAAASRARR